MKKPQFGTWTPVWVDAPPFYEQVLVSYTYTDDTAPSQPCFWRGAGHRTEDSTWVIHGELREMEPYAVVAWMPMPDPAYAILEQAKIVDCQSAVATEDDDRMCNERKKAK